MNENIPPVIESKLNLLRDTDESTVVVLTGAEVETIVKEHNLTYPNMVVYPGDPATGVAQAVQNLQLNEIEFAVIPGEYPVARLIVEKTIGEDKVNFTAIPSGVRDMFANEMMETQLPLMLKYMKELENIEDPDCEAVVAASL